MSNEKKKNKKEQQDKKVIENELQNLNEQIKTLETEKAELFEKLQRVSADYQNFQKRAPRQIADSIAYEKETLIKSLLPAMDNFEHTIQNAHKTEDIQVVVKGIQIVYDQLLGILRSYGIEPIPAVGEKFDPSMHQAMMKQHKDDVENNVVLEEFQKGYKINDRVLRPSKVIVNILPEEEISEQTQDEPENTENE